MMRMASPMSASRSQSVSLLARARIFAPMTVPGVVAASEGLAFFGLLTRARCIPGARVNDDKTESGPKTNPSAGQCDREKDKDSGPESGA